MDLSFVKENRNLACSYFVVMTYPDFKVFERKSIIFYKSIDCL